MRNNKLISKNLILGRLESSKEFKEGNKKTKKNPIVENEIESLKITVRDINTEDRKNRKLATNTRGVVIIEISNKSPLVDVLKVNDIILEIQETVIDATSIEKVVSDLIKKGETTLLLTVVNSQNQRRYIGVKVN